MRNVKLTLEYEGTNFFGSQKQKRHQTVQSRLESALRKLFQKKIKLTFAGRTDSGAHAEAQVVNFHTSSELPLFKIQLGLNHYLPKDIAVTDIEEAPLSFHAQFDAKRKVYEYRVFNSNVRPVLGRRRAFFYCKRLNVPKMKKAARFFVGRHDFRAFESSGGRRKSAVRTISRFEVKKVGKYISFTIESNGFLYKMVRSMVGTLLSVGSGEIKFPDLREILVTKNRRLVGPTLPAHGLTLKKIAY